MPRAALRQIAHELLELRRVTVAAAHIGAAIETETRYGISFWDALIIAAAESGDAEVVHGGSQ
jgi:predicted nucleic acid-binding protein